MKILLKLRLAPLFIALALSSSSARAVELKPGVTLTDMESFSTERLNVEILTTEDDSGALKLLTKQDFEYIKSFYGNDPARLDLAKLLYQIDRDYQKNYDAFGGFPFISKSSEFHFLAYVIRIKTTQEQIGKLVISDIGSAPNPQFSIYISSRKAHQHFGTEVTQAAIQFVKEKTKAEKIIWETFSDIPGSIGIAKNCGFTLDGKVELYPGREVSQFSLPLVPRETAQ